MTLRQIRYAIAVANTCSMNEAAKQLYISQPSLTSAIKELEEEIQITIFTRNRKGVVLTSEGEEFLGYARQIEGQMELLESKYLNQNRKKKFGVSTQHYSFAVKAFVEMTKGYDMNEYEFAIRETKTFDVLNDVHTGRSEIGILYINEFNEKIIMKFLKEKNLSFQKLITCGAYVYLWKGHPLAEKKTISMEDLQDYPCMSFEQGNNNSFYFAEEILSTYEYKKTIKVCDRATMLNLMVGLNGYTVCSGIICEELNGSDYKAVPLKAEEDMTIGYVTIEGMATSEIGKRYMKELQKYITSL